MNICYFRIISGKKGFFFTETLKEVRNTLGLNQNFSILLGKLFVALYLFIGFVLDDENTEKKWCEPQFRERLKRYSRFY